MSQGLESITKVAENGDVVMVMERRSLSDGKEGQFVLRVRNLLYVLWLKVKECLWLFLGTHPEAT